MTDNGNDLLLPAAVVPHLGYHAHLAAEFGSGGHADEAASEALLAWTILAVHGASEAHLLITGDLPTDRVAGVEPAQRTETRRRAHTLALELQAHFQSEGQSAAARLYERVAVELHPN